MAEKPPIGTPHGRFLPLVTRPGGLEHQKGVILPRDVPADLTGTTPGGGSTGGTRLLLVTLDGVGAVLTTGVKGEATLDFACTITGWVLLADQSGDLVIDIWKDTFANYPPTVADTITGGNQPELSATDHARDTTLSGWTKTVTAGDTFRFNIDSVATVTRATLALSLTEA